MQSGMQSEQARRWEAALDRARDDDWIHYATVSGWLASCLRRRQWARFALCGGVLMVLLHLTRSAAHVRHLPQASDDVPDADDHDDIVDARGAQVLPSSSPPPATATKTVWATRRPLAGNDYHCEDSDGMGSDACQIRCGAPCLEPFRLCMASGFYVLGRGGACGRGCRQVCGLEEYCRLPSMTAENHAKASMTAGRSW